MPCLGSQKACTYTATMPIAPMSEYAIQRRPKYERSPMRLVTITTFSTRRIFGMCSSKWPKQMLPIAKMVVTIATSNQTVLGIGRWRLSVCAAPRDQRDGEHQARGHGDERRDANPGNVPRDHAGHRHEPQAADPGDANVRDVDRIGADGIRLHVSLLTAVYAWAVPNLHSRALVTCVAFPACRDTCRSSGSSWPASSSASSARWRHPADRRRAADSRPPTC